MEARACAFGCGLPISSRTLRLCEPRRPYKTTRRQPIRWRCATGTDIKIQAPDGFSVSGWVVEPSDGDMPIDGRGVVLFSDILGHENKDTRSFASSLVALGITVAIPDLFRGKPWEESRPQSEYESWRATIDTETALADGRLFAEELRRRGLSIGALGFCFGGGRLMEELAKGPDGTNPTAAVVFYPTRFDPSETGKKVRCPLLGVFADKDKLVPESVVLELEEALTSNPNIEDFELVLYEGAGHGFAHHPKSKQDHDDADILRLQTAQWFMDNLTGDDSINPAAGIELVEADD